MGENGAAGFNAGAHFRTGDLNKQITTVHACTANKGANSTI